LVKGSACGEEQIGAKPLGISRLVQRKPATAGPAPGKDGSPPSADASTPLESGFAAIRGAGQPLPASVRSFFEPRFGYGFGHVRVHTGPAASSLTGAVQARAFTIGRDVVFGPGRYAPETGQGRQLLAHELTHVVQQSAAQQGAGGEGAHGRAPMPLSGRPSHAGAMIQRDTAGGGSTEFEDTVSTLSRPTSGPGPVHGTVTRREFVPASGSKKREQISTGEMNVRFDPADCSITIPFGYKFVQAAQSGDPVTCNEPPPATKVAPLAAGAFNRLKAGVLADVNRGLNGWFDVRLTGAGCPGGCTDKLLPIKVVAREDAANPDTTITVINRGGRANAGTICAGSWDASTAVHEGGHQTLGVGDEYPETDERLRATAPQWFRPERVRRDYSVMGPEEHSRFAMFHERHFHAVKTFLEDAFPNCTATLQARPRPVIPDYRLTLGGGYLSLSGVSGGFFAAGLRIGIPLDRLRRWEFVLGPQYNMFVAGSDQRFMTAFLLGARLGLEGSTGEAGHGFTAGAFAEGGYGWFSSSDYGPGGGGSRRAGMPYGELGLSAGYRTPLISGTSTRFDFRLEGALGSTIGAPGVIGPITRDIQTDPALSHWFRFGFVVGGQF
jgi:Domain of unknown function (DUF4157)